MRVLVVGLSMVCLWSGTAHAGFSRLAFGGYVGYALFRFDPDAGYKNRRALALGGHMEWGLGSRFYLQPELNYTRKGSSVEDSELTAGVNDISIIYDVLEAQLLVKMKFGPPQLRLIFLGGGYMSYAISKGVETTTAAGTTAAGGLEDTVATIDYGATAGFGGEFHVGEDSNMFIEGRYQLGLANLNTAPGSTSSLRTRGFLFLAGIRWWI